MDETSFTSEEYRSFIEEYIEEDILRNPRVQTRFPPEPNGYLHIGHAKAICIDFGMALKYGGTCNLRFDDTNPTKEDVEYVDSIKEDVRWLGFEWDHIYYASDYFDKLYEYAVQLIRQGKAFVCDLTAEQIKEYRGTLKEPGQNSPYCDRPIEENLRLFEAMKNGEYPDGSKVLRARIDMASPNVNMRDPVMYRILKARHHRTGDKWCIYPMYDYAHPVSDAIEGVTHSLCTLEFEDHRPLYDWFIREIGFEEPPRQIEFARLNITRTIMSKRYLKRLVDDKYVSGWDDPRMPTLCGLRRRGYTPESIRSFCERIGVAKSNSEVEASFMEHCIRDDLNEKAPRVMAVLDPVKLVIDNYPEGKTELITAEFMPDKPEFGTRAMTFSREVYIEREDFMEDPPKKFFRLSPGNETRLKSAYIIKCEHVVKDDDGNITEIHCTYDPATRSGESERKVKGTLHWVDAQTAKPIEVRVYDYLLLDDDGEKKDFSERMTPESLKVRTGCLIEGGLDQFNAGDKFQFIRMGYFCVDPDSTPELPVFNTIVGLKDSWAKQAGK